MIFEEGLTMKIGFTDKKKGAIGVVMFEGEEKKTSEEYGVGEFNASEGKRQLMAIDKNSKIVFAGLGKKNQFDAETLKKAIGQIVATFSTYKEKEITIDAKRVENAASTVVEAVILSQYSFSKYRKEKEEIVKIEKINLLEKQNREVEKQVNETQAIANAVNFARDIENEPANVATPTYLAELAKKTAGGKNVKCTIFDEAKLKELKCGALLGVAAGSTQPPVMVTLEYAPKKYSKTIAFVGKGITFDSGGISLKPSKDMDQMKFDKNGACAVIAIVKAVSELELPIKVAGVFAATENLPSGRATKPGDILTAYNGKTIEVLNTDAEGRLILADALSYTEKNYKPDYIVDIATLTGACVVALGSPASGLISNNEKLAKEVLKAGEESGDKCWQLPLWKEYEERIKSDIADVRNISTIDKEAGAITAAAFLKQFVGETPWAHLDIAGTAWATAPRDYYCKGATGAGVRICVKLCQNLAKQISNV